MAELQNTSTGESKKGTAVRRKKSSNRVDLTAMVDLAFLLITFFILTTTLQQPKAMTLIMPDKTADHEMAVSDARTMTILLGSNDKVEWYMGLPDKPLTAPSLEGFTGIRKALLEQAAKVKQSIGKDMIVLIKPSDRSKYANVVNIMDELNIVDNHTRAIIEITPREIELLKRDRIYN